MKTLQLARISQAVMDRSSRLPSMLSACVHDQLKLARHVTKKLKEIYIKKKLKQASSHTEPTMITGVCLLRYALVLAQPESRELK